MKFPKVKNKAFLSPMAGVTDVAFRALAKQYGAAMTYTEFINSTGLVRGNISSLNLLKTDPSENPVAIQLFGSSVDDVIEAGKMVEDKFDVIDVNCGCPAWKVIKTGAGSAMLKEPKKIGTFINKLVENIGKPITVKIRKGLDDKHINAVEVAKIIEDAGASAIAIHGRTQKQGYSGHADWDIIKKVKESVDIPIIGNGDVTSPESFETRLRESGVDYIMIARAAMNNPYIFQQINDYLKTGEYDDKFIFPEYLEYAKKHNIDFSTVKRHALAFTKGFVGGADLRRQISDCKDISDIEVLIDKLSEKMP